MKCRLTRRCGPVPETPEFPDGWLPIGFLREAKDCERPGCTHETPLCHIAILVLAGVAEPADDECARVCGYPSKERLAQLSFAADMMEKGIMPEDREHYKAGYMDGYLPDGNWKPGPNFDEWQQTEKGGPTIVDDDEDDPDVSDSDDFYDEDDDE